MRVLEKSTPVVTCVVRVSGVGATTIHEAVILVLIELNTHVNERIIDDSKRPLYHPDVQRDKLCS